MAVPFSSGKEPFTHSNITQQSPAYEKSSNLGVDTARTWKESMKTLSDRFSPRLNKRKWEMNKP